MLHAPAPFPHPGSFGFIDDRDGDGRDVVERVRILRDNRDGTCLISLASHRYPHEIASGNRTVEFAQLRETERAAPVRKPRKRRARK